MLCLLLLLSNFNICQLINKVIGLASDKGPLSQSHAVWLCLVPSELVQYCNVVSLGTLVIKAEFRAWLNPSDEVLAALISLVLFRFFSINFSNGSSTMEPSFI